MSIWDNYKDIEGAGFAGANMLGGMMGGGKNPANAAMDYYNQIPGMMKPYYDPYINAGRGALSSLQGQYGNMMSDPGGVMNHIGAGFQASPGYDFQRGQMATASNNAAAAGGMLGSPQHQQQSATMVNGLANQDYYNYLNHALGMYNTGLSGMSDINHMGYNASTGLADNLAQALMSQGNLAYEGQAARNQQQGNNWGAMIGGASHMLPYLM